MSRLPIADELFIRFGVHKYHVMHMRQPTVREPAHNQVRPMMKGFVEEVQEKMIILVRQNYLTLIRPVITYACGAWSIKQRKCVSTRLNFGLSTKVIDRNDSTIGFKRGIVCILRQISSKNTSEISKATNEVLPGLTDSASPEELFDM
ncbi:hypothetical protein FOIG_16344 [Fusarium odoratissimum NRRL 54006]|uniref:Uncharacterized protein n=1 Tax=Fusarium odoratissimum (strain NRRL 54006) TaxID=1089451 RepID=X0J2B4_FUSO5|nr:uncharacterized protein FOIG_16344 [Fusarium odoratissimum NRRL 54006]EXL90405.1 hypothetical protein FOIG_16344 [Fusarium odoratissimum NRRL 54006]